MATERDLAAQIAGAFNDLADEEPQADVCPTCNGDGWYVGHEDACYDSGDCVCSGVQIQCECAARVSGQPNDKETRT